MKGILSIQSHVVYGHAGNSSAVFPMQRLGFETWPIHTVQFSNHTQYTQGWKGQVFSAESISNLIEGIDALSELKNCQALISGYLGSAEQCDAIYDAAKRVKERNCDALYVCDPVMGSPEKGCIVAPGVAKLQIEQLMPHADIIVPNQFELAQFVAMEITDITSAKEACQKALNLGPKIVLVKHLHSVSQDKFSMMLATKDGLYLAQRPHLKFEREPVGVGDLITALFTAMYLKTGDALQAFAHANNACYAVLKKTNELNEWELQTVVAQEELITPTELFEIQTL